MLSDLTVSDTECVWLLELGGHLQALQSETVIFESDMSPCSLLHTHIRSDTDTLSLKSNLL